MLEMLRHPLTRGLDLDDPRTTLLRKRIIQEKQFLNKIYHDWYAWIVSQLPSEGGPVLELGSGAGFLEEYIPGLITSEVFFCPWVSVVLDGCVLPFQDASLRSIAMLDVFHHIPDGETFLKEAQRCLVPGGKVLMIEPWVTPWSRLIYRCLHHEPFDPEAPGWVFPATGPLSGANSALPWIVFSRDRVKFENLFPMLTLEMIIVEMPLRYLLSGGVSLRSLMPGCTYRFWQGIERCVSLFNGSLGMFSKIVLCRR